MGQSHQEKAGGTEDRGDTEKRPWAAAIQPPAHSGGDDYRYRGCFMEKAKVTAAAERPKADWIGVKRAVIPVLKVPVQYIAMPPND